MDDAATDGRAVELAAANDRDRTRPLACAMEISRAVGRTALEVALSVVRLLLLLAGLLALVDGKDEIGPDGC